jgi:hypothetical protein
MIGIGRLIFPQISYRLSGARYLRTSPSPTDDPQGHVSIFGCHDGDLAWFYKFLSIRYLLLTYYGGTQNLLILK